MSKSEPTPVPFSQEKNDAGTHAQMFDLNKEVLATTKKLLLEYQAADPQEFVKNEKNVNSLLTYLKGLGFADPRADEKDRYKELLFSLKGVTFPHEGLEEQRQAALERLEDALAPKRTYVKAKEASTAVAQKNVVEQIAQMGDEQKPLTPKMSTVMKDIYTFETGGLVSAKKMAEQLKALTIDDLADETISRVIAYVNAEKERLLKYLDNATVESITKMLEDFRRSENMRLDRAGIFEPDQVNKIRKSVKKGFLDRLQFWKK